MLCLRLGERRRATLTHDTRYGDDLPQKFRDRSLIATAILGRNITVETRCRTFRVTAQPSLVSVRA
jgi:hypothetical protein